MDRGVWRATVNGVAQSGVTGQHGSSVFLAAQAFSSCSEQESLSSCGA